MAQHWNGFEHRWGSRLAVTIPVQVAAQPMRVIDGRINNLSTSGALMEAAADLRLHTLVEVTIHLPPPSNRSQTVLAHVVRKLDHKVGLEWHEFAPQVVRELLRARSNVMRGRI
ncbi:MAG: hypothetical protein QOK23_674 [Gammaproteobacteria bacterium]|jgi:hypothetical protein|nr:hypothetical protein [Gammaproteobacteria bacterium]